MPMTRELLLLGLGLCLISALAGCLSPQPLQAPDRTLPPSPLTLSGAPEPRGTELPAPVAPPIPARSPEQPPQPAAGTATTAPVATTYVAVPSDPMVSDLAIRYGYFDTPIPNCIMGEIFPAYAQDPAYGISPGNPPKIAALSPQEMTAFLRDWEEGRYGHAGMIGFSACAGAPVDPYWNFVRISGRFVPRNAQPAEYEVTLVVKGLGKDLGIFSSTRRLTLEQAVSFESFIPIRTDQMEYIEQAELQFRRLAPG